MLLKRALKYLERPRPHAMKLCQPVGGHDVELSKMGVAGSCQCPGSLAMAKAMKRRSARGRTPSQAAGEFVFPFVVLHDEPGPAREHSVQPMYLAEIKQQSRVRAIRLPPDLG